MAVWEKPYEYDYSVETQMMINRYRSFRALFGARRMWKYNRDEVKTNESISYDEQLAGVSQAMDYECANSVAAE